MVNKILQNHTKAKETDVSSDLVILGKTLRPAGSSGLDLSLRKSIISWEIEPGLEEKLGSL